jgi:capsule biosynthesis phosphatase
MNIIVPMGGIGERFARVGYRFPKPLVNIVGRPMIFWLLDNLALGPDDRVYLAMNDSIESEFAIGDRLRTEYSSRAWGIETVTLNFQTRGAAETIFIVLQSMTTDRLGRKTVSLDCDTLYFCDVLADFRALPPGVNASFYFEDEGDKPVFSYLQLDAGSRVLDVREKVPISKHANTGAYAFASGLVLRKFCSLVLDEAVGAAGEFFLSSVIRKMLTTGASFRGVHVPSFACVGTPWQLTDFLRRIANEEIKCGRKMRFVFDLDNTLVTHPRVHGDYTSCEPKERNVRLLRELSAAGHYIIIWTARRMRTHKANVGAVIKDVGLITLHTLAQYDIPYDEVHFGKPYADLYVDDLAVNALVDTEKEIGWACVTGGGAAAQPERGMVASRAFNSVVVVDNTIIKSSKASILSGEMHFYRNIPASLRHIFPVVLSMEEAASGVSSITMERVRGVPASHLLAAHALTPGRLAKLLAALELLHTTAHDDAPAGAADPPLPPPSIYGNYVDKVLGRFEAHKAGAYAAFPDAEQLCTLIVTHLREYEAAGRGVPVDFIHGDPVFSNLLITNANDVFLIDMRGRVGDVHTTGGDVLYDLAKVYQSLCGYDLILLNGAGAGVNSGVMPTGAYASLSRHQEDYLRGLRQAFRAHLKASSFYSPLFLSAPGADCGAGTMAAARLRDVEMITASLYFSLIPLHPEEPARLGAYVDKCRTLVFSSSESFTDE